MENADVEEVTSGSPSPEKVQTYFSKIGLEVRKALRLHREAGLWDKNIENKRDWRNVSQHCLVEVARIDALAELLSFPDDLRKDLRLAAAVSDFFKKGEKEITQKSGKGLEAYAEAERKSQQILKEAGFSERTRYLADSTGTVHSITQEVPSLLSLRDLTNEQIAYLVLHYVDGYTIGSEWVSPAEVLLNGSFKNDFDRRIQKLKERYPYLDKQGFLVKQEKVGHEVEKRLAAIVSGKTGKTVNPKFLPEITEKEVIERIEQG